MSIRTDVEHSLPSRLEQSIEEHVAATLDEPCAPGPPARGASVPRELHHGWRVMERSLG